MPNTDKDENDLWREMPPSRHDRRKRYQPINEPEVNEQSDTYGGKPKIDKSRKNQKKAVREKPQKPERQKKPPKEQKPDYEKSETGYKIAKPRDIQTRALKQKQRKNDGRKRKPNPLRYIYYVVLFGVLFFILAAVLSTTVLFNTEKFEIKGSTKYGESEIIQLSGVTMGQNLITMDKRAVEQTLLQKLPYVDKVQVSVQLPNTLKITVTEAVAVANVEHDGRYYLISTNGRVMDAEQKKPDKNYITIYGFDAEYASSGDFLTPASEGSRNMLAKLLNMVKTYAQIDTNDNDAIEKYSILFTMLEAINQSELKSKIKSVDISNIYGITVNYDNKLTLRLGNINEVDLKLIIAQKLINSGEFKGEKGELILSDISESSDSMKVTFRPDYNNSEPNIGDSDPPPEE